ncbi:hypothetical protein [Larkinella soli]|uniref:hypothetical protein n=1 Tax=Larkinella soli TaxID=1770527 RepID=UPI000FFC7FEF|nr:hypothetical protein [Larkinella soli]
MLERFIQLITDFPLWFISDLFLLLAVAAGLVNLSFLNKPFYWLLILISLTLSIELAMTIYAAYRQNNHYLINLTSLVEMVCLAIVYAKEIRSPRSRMIIYGLGLIYLIAFLINFEWTRIADYMIGIQRISMIIFVFLHFQSLLVSMRVTNLFSHAMFWVSAGVLIYATGTLFVFLFVNKTLRDPSGDFTWYMIFTQSFSGFFYFVIALSFWLRRREVRMVEHSGL